MEIHLRMSSTLPRALCGDETNTHVNYDEWIEIPEINKCAKCVQKECEGRRRMRENVFLSNNVS